MVIWKVSPGRVRYRQSRRMKAAFTFTSWLAEPMQLSAKQKLAFTISLVGLLVVLAVLSRFWLADWPNFKPVAAVALFAGFLLGKRWLAWLVPLAILLLSDCLIGFYEWPVMVSVYASMVMAVGVGMILKSRFQKGTGIARRIAGIALGSLAISIVFFLTTNAAVVLAGWHPMSLTGFGESYVAGLPFLRYTVLGDALFSFGLFASYYAVLSVVEARQRTVQTSFGSARSAAPEPR